MKKPLAVFCELVNKPIPKLVLLEQIARKNHLAFHPTQFPAARDGIGSMEDGIVFAISDYLKLPAKEFAEITDTPPNAISRKSLDDVLLRSVEWIASKFKQGIAVPMAAWSADDRKISEAVQNLYRGVGHLAKEDGLFPHDTPDNVAAAAHFGFSFQHVIEKTLEWRKFDPTTTLLAYDTNKTLVGMTTVLPLTIEAYDRFRRGAVREFDITTNELDLLSQNLLVVVCTEWSDHLAVTKRNATRALFRSLTAQFARFLPAGTESSYRCLSIAPTTQSQARLMANGFRPVDGVAMTSTNIPIYEFDIRDTRWTAIPTIIRLARAANSK